MAPCYQWSAEQDGVRLGGLWFGWDTPGVPRTGWLVRCSHGLQTSSLPEAARLCGSPSKSGAPLPPEHAGPQGPDGGRAGGRAGEGRVASIGQIAAGRGAAARRREGPAAALPRGELVSYESTEVFKLFFRLFTEGTT